MGKFTGRKVSFDDLVPVKSRFITKNDINGEDGIVVTIKGFDTATLKTDNGGEEEKTVVEFEELDKPLVLNRTNSQLIEVLTGADCPDDSIGSKVMLYFDPTVSNGSKIVGGIRIRKAGPSGKALPKTSVKKLQKR